MKKLIPKCQSAWTSLQYKPSVQNTDVWFSTISVGHDNQASSRKEQDKKEKVAKRASSENAAKRFNETFKHSEILPGKAYVDEDGNMQIDKQSTINPGAGFVSGTDPIGEFYVA